ncbi:MAG: hypothetical protein JRN52_06750 [Nitrososphaerota archaeon]|nr:hypothetical protein [Nitrososphaerota archaeon]
MKATCELTAPARALGVCQLFLERENEEDTFLDWIFINETLEQKGEDWVVAALVDGSIGYYTAQSARIVVEEFKRGETENYSERCIALYKCNLLSEMVHDIKYFQRREESDQKGAQKLIKRVQESRTL